MPDSSLFQHQGNNPAAGAVANAGDPVANANAVAGANGIGMTDTSGAQSPNFEWDDVLVSNYQTEPSGNQFVEVANVGSPGIVPMAGDGNDMLDGSEGSDMLEGGGDNDTISGAGVRSTPYIDQEEQTSPVFQSPGEGVDENGDPIELYDAECVL